MMVFASIFSVNCRRVFTASTLHLNSKSVTPVTGEDCLKRGQKGFTKDGGHVYHGFTYYPRFPGHQDPPYEPSKVLMVQKIRCLKKKPYWDKNIMKQLGLGGIRSEIAILPNTPAINAMLWQVKHLIRITPVTLPQGLPADGDTTGAQLRDNGELTFTPHLKQSAVAAATIPQPQPSPGVCDMDGETLKKHLRIKWMKPWA